MSPVNSDGTFSARAGGFHNQIHQGYCNSRRPDPQPQSTSLVVTFTTCSIQHGRLFLFIFLVSDPASIPRHTVPGWHPVATWLEFCQLAGQDLPCNVQVCPIDT